MEKKVSIINEADDVQPDHEADMARSELYRAAEYATKLFKMIEPGDELQGWTQAKITKASDYLASVYHYMKYESKFGDSDTQPDLPDEGETESYNESVQKELTQSLQEQWLKRKQG